MRIYSKAWCNHHDNLSFGDPIRMFVFRGFKSARLCAVKCGKCERVKLHRLRRPLHTDVRE